ncbi:MAG TPA: hypothetical protein VGR07_16770 [Thermoanaerobaculia bacterium]|jgi:acyl carrier protein|nr:hypothetical protein [Thermoanaerobaculia bacterium]
MQPNPEPALPIEQSREMARIKAWLLNVNPEMGEVSWETQLIAERVLDSLQMVSFLLFIEEVRGREIPEAMIRPECFASLQSIFDNFFQTLTRGLLK